ncbi:MAG: zinc ABC transporter substrate-binding protein [Clostridia bacterium]|nr:zinc ABC transporter substrate-binding protein [Clostridia bacterium]
MKKIIKLITVLLSASLLISGCGAPKTSKTTDKINIVTTNFPPYDFSCEIAGDLADVTMLLSPGQESHTFEPTPQDIIKLEKADIFIIGGGESDEWAKKLSQNVRNTKLKVLSMMECVEILPEDMTHHEEDHSGFYEYDEHVWTSPENAKKICEEIASLLILVDKDNETVYKENLNEYIGKLEELDKSFFEVLNESESKTIIFGDRFPFRYFADRYGILYFAAFPGCSGETEPDAATMKFLIDKTKEEKIPVVFYTELSNHKIADAICEVTGAKPMLLHSCHGITKDEFERGETYLSLMGENVNALKEALSR